MSDGEQFLQPGWFERVDKTKNVQNSPLSFTEKPRKSPFHRPLDDVAFEMRVPLNALSCDALQTKQHTLYAGEGGDGL